MIKQRIIFLLLLYERSPLLSCSKHVLFPSTVTTTYRVFETSSAFLASRKELQNSVAVEISSFHSQPFTSSYCLFLVIVESAVFEVK